jgi:hypothetical protein
MQHSLMLFCSPRQLPLPPLLLPQSLAFWKSTYPSAGHARASEMSDAHDHDDHLVATMIYRSSSSFHPHRAR